MQPKATMSDFSTTNIPPTPTNNNSNYNNNAGIVHQQRPIMYNPNRPGFLPDRTQNASFGKRTLADFQSQQFQQPLNPLLLRHIQQQQQQAHGIGPFSMRSVKPRIYQNPSLLPTLDMLAEIGSGSNNAAYIGRYAMSSQLQRPHNTFGFGTGSIVPSPPTSLLPYNHNSLQNGVVAFPGKRTDETEKKIIMNRLQELEKQLLDDDIDEHDASGGGDSVSVITGNEWTETIQNLISSDQKTQTPQQQQQTQQHQINTPSPTSSSSSCSSTVASPLLICPKQLINEAAAAIAGGKSESAAEILTRVAQLANPRGTPDQKLAYYMSLSLKSKLNSLEGQKSATAIRSKEHYDSVQLLYRNSACFKLGFFAANLAIIEATMDAKSLHVVDFDLGDGKKYHNLLQLIALRKSGKPSLVKITAVDVMESGVVDEERQRIASERLSQLSERVGVPLEIKTLRFERVKDVSRESLGSNENEVLAVNLAYILSKLPDESVSTENQRDELLRRVKGLKARIVTVVEQEMNCNTAPFQTRVAECCSFYGALFESLDTNPGMGREDVERIRVEEGMGRVMMNTLACEGGERVERCEVLGKWRARMGMAGFEMKPVSQNVVESISSRIMNNKINSVVSVGNGNGETLFVKEINGGVCFGWMGRILTVTSAWC